MGMKSILNVCGKEVDNYKCKTELKFPFERMSCGDFENLDIYCGYDTGYGSLYLRICLIDFEQTYIYKLDYDIRELNDPEWAEFKMTFDLTDAIDQIDPTKIWDEIEVCICTCWCSNKDCDVHSEFSGYVIEKLTVLKPVNEKKPATEQQKRISEQLDELQKLSNQIPDRVVYIIWKLKYELQPYDELPTKLNNILAKISEHKNSISKLLDEFEKLSIQLNEP